MSQFEIVSMLVLSTAHISPDLASLLDDAANDDPPFSSLDRNAPAFARGEGWIFHVPPVDSDRDANAYPELRAAWEIARANGCAWVLYDCDGPTVENLPTYEW